MSGGGSALTAPGASRDMPRSVRRDLRYLWIDVRFAASAMKHAPDRAVEAASPAPLDVVGRIESELTGEASRYRYALYACLAVGVMPAVLAAAAWSGLYWLPVTVPWFPFERGYYGLPWLSLYEWLAYLMLAFFAVIGVALIADSHAATRRLSADYHRLAGAGAETRCEFVQAVLGERLARTELLLRSSRVFADYRELIDSAADHGRAPIPADEPDTAVAP